MMTNTKPVSFLFAVLFSISVPDALVLAGNISNASDAKEYRMLEWSMNTFNRIPHLIPAAGNHDVRARDSYEEVIGNFCDFASFCGIETDKAYYTATINQYPFIAYFKAEIFHLA